MGRTFTEAQIKPLLDYLIKERSDRVDTIEWLTADGRDVEIQRKRVEDIDQALTDFYILTEVETA